MQNKKSPQIKKVLLLLGGLLVFFDSSPSFISAQTEDARAYHYDSIGVEILVHKDTTFDVEEKQVFNYTGEYHKGWRSIPIQGLDAITNIQVIDGATGSPLEYSEDVLEKTDPASWSKFTTYRKDGAQNIEWYYDMKDTTHEWIIRYTVHGGLAFYKDHDELYWNLFTDYDASVNKVSARVDLPEAPGEGALTESFYSSSEDPAQNLVARHDAGSFYFSAENIAAQQKLTIAPGWPKGIVDPHAYWYGDFWRFNWGWVLALLVFVSAIIFCIFRWYFTERYHAGRGTIIPQYEPPEHLRPAMAEVIVREGITQKAWPATIVDLAVRGYVKIEEDPPRWWKLFGKEYTLQRIPNKDESTLEGYEKKFLDVLFGAGLLFSTKELKSNYSKQREMFKDMQKLQEELYKETETETKAYDVGLTKEKTGVAGLIVALVAAFVVAQFLVFSSQFILFSLSLAVSALLVIYFLKFEARLNLRGQILREDWLGFKLYLETAERYRMQNLTPEIFEKYLPYAMIFGVEKKWARAFESLNIPAPGWYSNAGVTPAFASGASAGFSPTGFASGFSASFASSFASSGAAGASGGGGGAGGGGGGGGGGAS